MSGHLPYVCREDSKARFMTRGACGERQRIGRELLEAKEKRAQGKRVAIRPHTGNEIWERCGTCPGPQHIDSITTQAASPQTEEREAMDTCKTPGCDKPVKRNKNGRSFGYCEVCYSEVLKIGHRRAKAAKGQAASPAREAKPKQEPPPPPDHEEDRANEGTSPAQEPAPSTECACKAEKPVPGNGAERLGCLLQEQVAIYEAAGDNWSCSKKTSSELVARLVKALGDGGQIPGWQSGQKQAAA